MVTKRTDEKPFITIRELVRWRTYGTSPEDEDTGREWWNRLPPNKDESPVDDARLLRGSCVAQEHEQAIYDATRYELLRLGWEGKLEVYGVPAPDSGLPPKRDRIPQMELAPDLAAIDLWGELQRLSKPDEHKDERGAVIRNESGRLTWTQLCIRRESAPGVWSDLGDTGSQESLTMAEGGKSRARRGRGYGPYYENLLGLFRSLRPTDWRKMAEKSARGRAQLLWDQWPDLKLSNKGDVPRSFSAFRNGVNAAWQCVEEERRAESASIQAAS
jgi:hypothetical protein